MHIQSSDIARCKTALSLDKGWKFRNFYLAVKGRAKANDIKEYWGDHRDPDSANGIIKARFGEADYHQMMAYLTSVECYNTVKGDQAAPKGLESHWVIVFLGDTTEFSILSPKVGEADGKFRDGHTQGLIKTHRVLEKMRDGGAFGPYDVAAEQEKAAAAAEEAAEAADAAAATAAAAAAAAKKKAADDAAAKAAAAEEAAKAADADAAAAETAEKASDGGSMPPQHGHGTYTYSDGVYTGDFKDGKRHGKGTQAYTTASGGFSYEGDWANGQWHGKGTSYHLRGR